MFTVYWTEIVSRTPEYIDSWRYVTGQDLTGQFPRAECQMAELDSLTEALELCESLRKQRREGASIRAITMVSENPDSVGQAGVDVTGPSYDWKKRRV